MNRTYRFGADALPQLQQSLDEIPPCPSTELSKQQMIRALSPQIFALRSKGYSWTAVATMLSERGVPVSVAALRTYLRRVREEATHEKERTPQKRSRDARENAARTQPTPLPTPVASNKNNTPLITAPSPAVPSAASPGVTSSRSNPETPKESPPRRSSFSVRPDTENI
jgi:hypothetical protein